MHAIQTNIGPRMLTMALQLCLRGESSTGTLRDYGGMDFVLIQMIENFLDKFFNSQFAIMKVMLFLWFLK